MGLLRGKLSIKNLTRLYEENATNDRVLVIDSENVPYQQYIPNAHIIAKSRGIQADVQGDLDEKLSTIEDESFEMILCTGLLEHVPEPQRFINDLHRILKPGGKLIVHASAVYCYHEGPNDFFHFTPFSFKLLFSKWSSITIRGSSQPFETIAILLQRILFQCEVKYKLVRLSVEILCLVLPKLDRFIGKQYTTLNRNIGTEIDSMMPSNIQAVAIK
ncbi:MAG: class I SAM-dependent methyltransferase [Scytonema sp. PMC 1070.18]|nr:class I SAM-dependent methyltransferase [Scytonema sp. PMC 1070.18]